MVIQSLHTYLVDRSIKACGCAGIGVLLHFSRGAASDCGVGEVADHHRIGALRFEHLNVCALSRYLCISD
eukprot:6177113-Pleurochrysis_carterae.AAC.1